MVITSEYIQITTGDVDAWTPFTTTVVIYRKIDMITSSQIIFEFRNLDFELTKVPTRSI